MALSAPISQLATLLKEPCDGLEPPYRAVPVSCRGLSPGAGGCFSARIGSTEFSVNPKLLHPLGSGWLLSRGISGVNWRTSSGDRWTASQTRLGCGNVGKH